MIVPREPQEPATKTGSLIEHKGLRQFVKFVLVGLSSTVVNFALVEILYYRLHLLSLLADVTIAFVISVCNGFIWNRRWTFKHARHNAAHEQYVQFMAVNLVGWFLNNMIVVLIVAHYSGGGVLSNWQSFLKVFEAIALGTGKHLFRKMLVYGSMFAAASVVVFWNFFANRHWTFKHAPLDTSITDMQVESKS
jgi:putative flippase GtrA